MVLTAVSYTHLEKQEGETFFDVMNRLIARSKTVTADMEAVLTELELSLIHILTVDRAQELGEQFCKEHFPGHQALICTHPDGHNPVSYTHLDVYKRQNAFRAVLAVTIFPKPFSFKMD